MAVANRARFLRKRETWAERLVWAWLRDRRFSDFKFRRQHPFGPYVLDFFCMEAALAVELDGCQHGMPARQERDLKRDNWLAGQGIEVLRFWNSRLRREKEAIRNAIWQTLQERAPQPVPDYCRPIDLDNAAVMGLRTPPHPNPLPEGEGTLIATKERKGRAG